MGYDNADFRTHNQETIKERIPIFENGTAEVLLLKVRDFNALCKTYELWANLNVTNIYGKFRQCLKGDTIESWNEIIGGEAKTEADFATQIIDLIVEKFGMDTHKDQEKYLRNRKKPGKMPVKNGLNKLYSLTKYFL